MDMHTPHIERRSARDRLAAVASAILMRVFQSYAGSVRVRLWDGTAVDLGRGAPNVTVAFSDQRAFRSLVLNGDPLRLAEHFFTGAVDVEGDLDDLLGQRAHLRSLVVPARERLKLLLHALFVPSGLRAGATPAPDATTRNRSRFLHRHTRKADRAAIAFHYDVSNEFYRVWLDEQLVYSCAYFENESDTLDRAQRNKLDHICRKLRLKPGERLLDIGCGWGALVRWAAQYYGVRAHGITLSEQQYVYARQKIRESGLEDRVTVELRDYRDVPGEGVFDKIVSVGMFEHVGLKNLPLYFRIVRRLLKDDGLFLNHGITHDAEGWRKTFATQFINRYVFPDGELDTVSNIQREMERAGFEILDVEALRRHYALTLRHWVRRLESKREHALRYVNEPTYRVWRLYMSSCALAFEDGGTGVYQILLAPQGSSLPAVPLTRCDLYDDARARSERRST